MHSGIHRLDLDELLDLDLIPPPTPDDIGKDMHSGINMLDFGTYLDTDLIPLQTPDDI